MPIEDRHIDMEEESEDEDDLKPEYVCPFCLDDFDLVGFCCHIDDAHPIDAKSGVLLVFSFLLIDSNLRVF